MKDRIEELKDDGDVENLLKILKGGVVEEREEAAKALGMLGSEDALYGLVNAVKNDPASTVRANAALALSSLEGEDCKKALKSAADDEDWEVRHDVAIAMGDFDDDSFEETLCSLMKDAEKEVRKKAIDSLGELAGEEKISEITEFIDDESLKINAVRAISEIGTEEAVEPLKKAYYQGDQDIREIAVQGLGGIQSEKTIDILLDALKDESWRVREDAAKILGEKGDESVIDPLLDRLDDQKNYVVEAALQALGKIGTEEVLEQIHDKIYSEDPGVRIAAVDALTRIETERAAEGILELLNREKNPRVLWSISDSLSNLSKDILEELKEHIRSIPEDKNIFISASMTKAGFSGFAEDIIDALDSDRWKIRQKAAESLEDIDVNDISKRNRKKLFRSLSERLKDNDKWVRARAIKTLSDLTYRYEDIVDYESIRDEIYELEKTEVDEDVLEAVRQAKQTLKKRDETEGRDRYG